MEYTQTLANGQLAVNFDSSFILIPSSLAGFHNTKTVTKKAQTGRTVFCLEGELEKPQEKMICPECGSGMHVHGHPEIELWHLSMGENLVKVKVPHTRYKCPVCGKTVSQHIPFKANGHRITWELFDYTRDLLAAGFTNKEVSTITGLGKNTVKDIDKERLEKKYTIDGIRIRKPEKTTHCLGIDEFKLHHGHIYATVIIDMENGHVLWIGYGKKKQVVYDFIDHVGMKWMSHVECVSCDMNSDFQEAFEERCHWIQPVYDYFHIVKNFNDNVIKPIRLEEQKRLSRKGEFEAAGYLKNSRFILTANRETLQKKDRQVKEGFILKKASSLFKTPEVVRKGSYEDWYDQIIRENSLLLTCDIIKEKLHLAYKQTDESRMAEIVIEIMDLCEAAHNEHLTWFRNLIYFHFEGIIAHGYYKVSNSKLEGLNNKIKTVRRKAYGYNDDEYFFLKIFDASRTKYVRNPKSHRIYD